MVLIRKFNINNINALLRIISPIKRNYPNFENWFNSKVLNGLSTGERSIFIATPLFNKNLIMGVLILKNSEEKKICTLYVLDKYRHKGIGKKFFKRAFKELKTRKPIITINKSIVPLFEKLLGKFDFNLTDIKKDLYIKGDIEYIFNGEV